MSKLTIRDMRNGLVYESRYQQNAKNRILQYLESSCESNEYIVYIDGYVVGELSSEQYDEFKYMFHLHPKKVAEESSDEEYNMNIEYNQNIEYSRNEDFGYDDANDELDNSIFSSLD